MKLSDVKPFFETSGEMEEHSFDIENKGMMFDILRSKMYSNPILAICREISSNARDAHREAGKPDEPIHIHLPTGLEPNYSIKDFGPGISPDRMINVFIKYTASTKRDDNVQTGGFGLGAKTPFSYSDQFQVTTIVNGIRYSYACSIDETKIGKIHLLDKRPTSEPNGTEVSIPVKSVDFSIFRQWTEQACRHWHVKPVIVNSSITWQTFNKVLEGDGWAIASTEGWERSAKLVIDGIEYPLELDALRKYADSKLIDAARGTFIMYFGVGELSLSATREQIYLDKATQSKISARLNKITKEIKDKVVAKIDSFPNLWDANIYYREELSVAFHTLNFLGKLSWQGVELHNGYMDVKCKIFSFSKGKYSRKYGSDPNKITRSASHALSFDEHSMLFLNDLSIKEPTPRHVKKAFEDNTSLKSVQVVCVSDDCTEESLNKSISLDKMAPNKLSSITKAFNRKYTASSSRLLIYKYIDTAGGFRQVSYDSMEEDTNHKVICLLEKVNYDNGRNIIVNNKIFNPCYLTSVLAITKNISFYGVDKATNQTKIEEEFGDFEDIEDYINDNVLNNNKINFVEIKFATQHNYHIDERMILHAEILEKKIKDPNSLYLQNLHLHQKIKKLGQQDTGLMSIYEIFDGEIDDKKLLNFLKDNPDWDIEKFSDKVSKKYPLIHHLNSYSYNSIMDPIIQYINLIDKN